MIDAILDWAENHPDFDTSFVESLQGQLDQGRNPSVAQIDALENIIERFRIKV